MQTIVPPKVLRFFTLILACTAVLSTIFVTFHSNKAGGARTLFHQSSKELECLGGNDLDRGGNRNGFRLGDTPLPEFDLEQTVPQVVRPELYDEVPPFTPDFQHTSLAPSSIADPNIPKIEIITIWDARKGRDPAYLPMFFHSVKLNPRVKLLLVEIHKGEGCKRRDLSENVKHLCLSKDEYFELHVEYFCQRWRCTDTDKTLIATFLKNQSAKDKNHSFYRILRGAVFSKFLDPETTIWGWCDFDTYWGNFERMFPWDIAHNFDIIAVGWQQESEQIHLFMRGHMSFFRNHPSTLAKLATYPLYSSFAVLRNAAFRIDAEESYLSHYVFSENDQFTFLLMGGLPAFQTMVFFSDAGVWTTLEKVWWRRDENKGKPESDNATDLEPGVDEKQLPQMTRERVFQMFNPTSSWGHDKGGHSNTGIAFTSFPPGNTFSPSADETPALVFHHGSNFKKFKWYPDEYLIYVEPGWTPAERLEKGYIIRREPGGNVTQRLEPRERYMISDEKLDVQFDECLYMHFQLDKLKPFFNKLYNSGIPFQGGNLNIHWGQDGGDIWNREGNIVKQAGWTRSK